MWNVTLSYFLNSLKTGILGVSHGISNTNFLARTKQIPPFNLHNNLIDVIVLLQCLITHRMRTLDYVESNTHKIYRYLNDAMKYMCVFKNETNSLLEKSRWKNVFFKEKFFKYPRVTFHWIYSINFYFWQCAICPKYFDILLTRVFSLIFTQYYFQISHKFGTSCTTYLHII